MADPDLYYLESHRGGNKKQTLQKDMEKPELSLWQSLLRWFIEVVAMLSLSAYAGGWILSLTVAVVVFGVLRSFNSEDDPATDDVPCVIVSGVVRLGLEFCIFGLGIFCLTQLFESNLWAYANAGIVVFHYITYYKRVVWMVQNQ